MAIWKPPPHQNGRVVLLVLLMLASTPATGCECIDMSLKRAFKNSDLVVAGTVTSSRKAPGGYGSLATLDITSLFKGRPDAKTVSVDAGGMCGFDFQVGERYVVHAQQERDTFYTGHCTHTYSLNTERGARTVEILRTRSWWWRWRMSGRSHRR